jgi:hypothetical protein
VRKVGRVSAKSSLSTFMTAHLPASPCATPTNSRRYADVETRAAHPPEAYQACRVERLRLLEPVIGSHPGSVLDSRTLSVG